MKRYLIAAAVLAICATGAHAKCSTKALNGQWMWGNDIFGSATPIVLTNGTGVTGTGVTINLTLSKSCKGNVTLTSGPLTLTGRVATERISPLSDLKPNLLQFGIPAQGADPGLLWTMFRL